MSEGLYVLRVLAMLVVVAGMAIGTLWLMRKLQPGLATGSRERAVRIVDAVSLGPTGGRLAVVEFEGKRLLVGISRAGIQLISEAPGEAFARYIDDGEA
ncbi:MAG TPA: flagellar biosynthetic protein FliO [Sphingomonas sp.]